MDNSDILNGIVVRAPWQSVARPVFRHAGCIIHQGPEKTVSGILSGESPDANFAWLGHALVEHIVSGEKLVKVVKLNKTARNGLKTWIQQRTKESNTLTDAYPGVATRSGLVPFQNQEPKCVGWIERPEGIAAVYTAARAYLKRVEVPQTSLQAHAADGYEKLYGMKRIFVQTYDVVWLPTEGDFACIVVDLPNGSPANFAVPSLISLSALVKKALKDLEFYNLWPAVDGLHKATGEGKLVDYGFIVEGKAVNHHKARKISGCLRSSTYDIAGALSVGDEMDVFKVSVEWARKIENSPDSHPEVTLPGTALHLSAMVEPVLDHFIIRDSLSSSDLNFVVSKLMPYLT